ncbi:carbon-nitrogen hydrolase [Xylariaceae sp. AK1471]|nr:carbon-nitrogen hydrolase [Xylariaceae sp. AK1471]
MPPDCAMRLKRIQVTKFQPKFLVAADHTAPVFLNKAATIKKVICLIEQAAAEKINLLVFPETIFLGYPVSKACPPSVDAQAGVAINLGVSERMIDGHTRFNSQVTIDGDGAILGVHRKLQPTYVERMVWAQGGTAPRCATGHSLSRWVGIISAGWRAWENTMNGARQALITQNEHIHAGAWPALSSMVGFEDVADAQIEALMKAHALTAQVFVVTASNYVDETCLRWMRENVGEQDLVKAGGGWSAVLHQFCAFFAGPHTGAEEMDAGQRFCSFVFDNRPHWADEKTTDRFKAVRVESTDIEDNATA